MHYEPIIGPGVWYGRQLRKRDDWIRHFNAAELEELAETVRAYRARGAAPAEISPATFPLPTLGPVLRAVLAELLEGRGFIMLRGLPVERWASDEQAIACMGIGSWLGRPRSQNAKGHLLGHVKDLGLDIRDSNVRYYQTNRRLEYHTDSVDIVALLCLKAAKSGGESYLARSITRYNEMLARQYIESAQKLFPEATRLTRAQIAAMDLLDDLCNDAAIHLSMDFRPGDIQLLHNHQILHSRADFENWPEPERHRHLLRLWLAPIEARPLPQVYAPRYGGIVPGERGGIMLEGTKTKVPLQAE